MTDYLMRIVVNEQQEEKKEQTYKAVLSYLWEQGAPGATMRRGDAGIDNEGNVRFDFLEDVYYNNLPIIIESILDGAVIQKLEGGMKSLVKHGQISISKGFDEADFNEQEYFIVKVYTSEKKKLLKKEQSEKILSFLRSKNVIWATVTKGIAGYGRDHVIYSQHLFPLSEHMPLVVECIVDKDNHSSLIEELRQVITEGAVISLPVDLILNR
ncbi:MAG: hypothetical protein K0Q48_905 [Bacillota bacterium]|jgi:PII-like signaling protein|nr:hypothetical protein [Bacillota bacterium]